MIVLAALRGTVLDPHRTGHAEVKDQHASIVKVRNRIARPATTARERPPLELRRTKRPQRRAQFRREDLDLLDLPLLQRAIQRPRNGFSFR